MLEFYFDDSGTHTGSRVAVWGGIIGYTQYCDELKAAWKARLASPCERRPAIRKFHSSSLAAGRGEFESYSEGEKDLTRRNFRQVILDAGITVLAFGISVDDWSDIVTGDVRVLLGSANRLVFAQALRDGCKDGKAEGQPLSFQFDKGCQSPELNSIIQPAIEAAEMDGHQVRYGFASVVDSMCLQAADLVAHEAYRFLTDYIDNPHTEPTPHLRRLFEGAHDAQVRWTGRKQIQRMADHIRSLIDAK